MPQITLKRDIEKGSKSKELSVIIDDFDFANLMAGQRKTIQIPPGRHTLKARMGWLGSKNITINIEKDDYKFLHIKKNKYMKKANVLTVCIVPVYLFFLMPYSGFFLSTAILISMYLAFIIFFGKDKYFNIVVSSPE